MRGSRRAERRRPAAARRCACARIVLPTCSSSRRWPSGGPSSDAASRSAAGSGRGLYDGCTPFGTTTIRSAGIAAADTSASRVAALTHRIFRAALIPSSRRRPSARSTIDPVATREHAAKGVEIVAGDDRPARRQPPRQMRVAVVDDVEEIEVPGPGTKPSRVVPDAVEDPIRGLGGGRDSDERQPGQASHHRRTQLRRIDEPRARRPQIEQQHLGDEIHRVPPLFAKVRHHGHSRQVQRLTPAARVRATNQTCVPRCGPGQLNGDVTVRTRSNLDATVARSTRQLNPL